MVLMFVIPFIVQCFYGWRLWIMSDGNLLVTICVILLSAAQCVSGVAFTFGLRLPTNYLRALFSVTTVICDILITASVWYYLRTSRLKRTRTAIQRIVTVTMHMGAFTSLIALWVWVMWVTQGAIPQILTPLMMTSQTYNLDKPQSSIELPTLSIP
ncbi:hypothetical protein SCLCIDRAFT_686854 [Scleroderma citrinum Foug A]|uniref:DUF6534 domain-containing protein n=1 Tax=Scleroderma citrinum Foug A TaxID=1036808 RepID=A0A0C2ZDM4_9AGAM|nr:hypothetical protein SCLCIDRAFT_686854 [Scleroderma citrinum Foug A]